MKNFRIFATMTFSHVGALVLYYHDNMSVIYYNSWFLMSSSAASSIHEG